MKLAEVCGIDEMSRTAFGRIQQGWVFDHSRAELICAHGVQRIASDSPDDPDVTLMLRVKGNLSKSKGGLRYRIKTRRVTIDDQSVEQPLIYWDGSTAETADGTLLVENDPGEGKIRSAMNWVKTILTEGRRRARDIYEEAETSGFMASTVKTASQRIGVSKVNELGDWYWDLPTTCIGAIGGIGGVQ
jgi:hypothetical protein